MKIELCLNYKKPLLFLFLIFVVASIVLDPIWGITIVITIYLLEIDSFHEKNSNTTTVSSLQHWKIHNQSNLTSTKYDSVMYPSNFLKRGKDSRNSDTLDERSGGRPSLMSLIHGKNLTSDSKENYYRYASQQPLLARVKNNMYIRKSISTERISHKSPLYRNMLSSPLVNRSSSFNTPPSFQQYTNEPMRSTMKTPLSYVNSPNRVESEFRSPNKNGLEVHGSYFINKSILHNEDAVESFSLVNDSFNSPLKDQSRHQNNHPTPTYSETIYRHGSHDDQTSTEAVISALREKSKRKRQAQSAYEDSTSFKKVRYDDDILESTLNELFPPVEIKDRTSVLRRRKLSSVKSTKKLVSAATQCEYVDETELKSKRQKTDELPDLTVCTKKSSEEAVPLERPSRSKFGLTEKQTDEMLDDSLPNKTLDDTSVIDDTSLESAIEHVKASLTGFPGSTTKKVAFQINSTQNEDVNSANVNSVSSKGSALKNLKSPYKKLLNTSFPSNLKPGSTEKRRKHPVYFTAKIDVDEIQSNREEYGERGASLKAFRLDQEEAAKRVNDLLEESEDSIKLVATSSSAKETSSTDFKISAVTNLIGNSSLPTSSNQSSGSIQPIPPLISFSAATPTVPSETSSSGISLQTTTAQSGLSFSFPPAAPKSSLSAVSTTPSLSSSTSKSVTFAFNSQPTSNQRERKPPTTVVQPFSSTSNNLANADASKTSTASGTGFSFPIVTSVLSTTTAISACSGTATPSQSGFSFSVPPVSAIQNSQFPATSTQPNPTTFTFNSQPASSLFGSSSSSTTSVTSTAIPTIPAVKNNVEQNKTDIFQLNTAANSKQYAMSAFSTLSNKTNTGFNFTAGAATIPSGFTATTSLQATSASSVPSAAQSIFGVLQKSQAPTDVNPAQGVFGAPNTAATQSVFGAPNTATTQSVFGAPNTATSQSVFGTPNTTTTQSVFGAPNTATSQSVFGAPNTAATQSVFGAPNTTTTPSVFGAPNTATSQSVFGAPNTATTQSVFGAPNTATSQSVFGAPNTTTTPSVFGAPNTTTTQSVFGAPNTATTQSVFGGPNAPAAQNVFGTANTGSTSNVFSSQPTPAPGFFGASNAATTKSAFGASNTAAPQNVFGAPQTTQNGFKFGITTTTNSLATPSSQSVFGAPSTKSVFQSDSTKNVFGNSASVFGQQQAGSFQFGSNQAPTSSQSGFSFGAPVQSSTFGAPSSSVFGSATNPSAAATPFGTSSSAFGLPSAPQNNNNPFGATNKPTNGFDFSASLKQGPSLNFGASPSVNNVFGGSNPAKPFSFTNEPPKPSFGAPSQPSFGNAQPPTFGTPTNFNTPTGAGFTIGASASTNRPIQRARRRTKR